MYPDLELTLIAFVLHLFAEGFDDMICKDSRIGIRSGKGLERVPCILSAMCGNAKKVDHCAEVFALSLMDVFQKGVVSKHDELTDLLALTVLSWRLN